MVTRESAMTEHLSQPTIREIAADLGCSSRTVNRMKRRGIDVKNPAAVAAYLVSNPKASPRMLETILPKLTP